MPTYQGKKVTLNKPFYTPGEAKKKGADDPKALAAWIGRKKLGAKEFIRRSVAGRKKAK